MDITTINDAFIVTALVGAILPAVVAIVTNRFASSQFKSLTLLGLTGVSSVLTPLVGQAEVNWRTVVTTFLIQFGSAVLAYYGAIKPLNIANAIQTAVPGGIGKEVPVVTAPTVVDDKSDIDSLVGEEVDDELALEFEDLPVAEGEKG